MLTFINLDKIFKNSQSYIYIKTLLKNKQIFVYPTIMKTLLIHQRSRLTVIKFLGSALNEKISLYSFVN